MLNIIEAMIILIKKIEKGNAASMHFAISINLNYH